MTTVAYLYNLYNSSIWQNESFQWSPTNSTTHNQSTSTDFTIDSLTGRLTLTAPSGYYRVIANRFSNERGYENLEWYVQYNDQRTPTVRQYDISRDIYIEKNNFILIKYTGSPWYPLTLYHDYRETFRIERTGVLINLPINNIRLAGDVQLSLAPTKSAPHKMSEFYSEGPNTPYWWITPYGPISYANQISLGSFRGAFLDLPGSFVIFGAYTAGIGQQYNYSLPYSSYTAMVVDPSVIVTWSDITGIRANLYGINPYTADKRIYGVRLIKQNGEKWKIGDLGNTNKFYMVTNYSNKLIYIDSTSATLKLADDPGSNRGEQFYYYFVQSHTPNFFYWRSDFDNGKSMQHNYNFPRPNSTTNPGQTQDDAFLWMVWGGSTQSLSTFNSLNSFQVTFTPTTTNTYQGEKSFYIPRGTHSFTVSFTTNVNGSNYPLFLKYPNGTQTEMTSSPWTVTNPEITNSLTYFYVNMYITIANVQHTYTVSVSFLA